MGTIIFFSLLAITGFCGVIYFFKTAIIQCISIIRIYKSTKWRTTQGEVIDANYYYMQYRGSKSKTRHTEFILIKTFTYTVNGKLYKSNQTTAADSLLYKQIKPISSFPENQHIIFNEGIPTNTTKPSNNSIRLFMGSKTALTQKAKQCIGEKLNVYFNPNNPKKACLTIKNDSMLEVSILVMLAFGVISAYFCYFMTADFLLNAINKHN